MIPFPSSLELAYLGDTLYDLYVRERLVRHGGHVKTLHRKAVSRVCCAAQSRALARVEPLLTEEEADVVRRARNAHQTAPRNADPADYHRATGLEALLGWLYLNDRQDRLQEILDAALADDPDLACGQQKG